MYRKIILVTFILLVGFSIIYALMDKRTVTTSSEKAYKAYMRGEELCRKLYFKEALKEFELAIKHDPEFAMAYMEAATIYKSWDRIEDYENAKSKAISLMPKIKEKERIQINLEFANMASAATEAEKFGNELIEKYPESLEALVVAGNRYFSRREWDDCIRIFTKITENDPDYALAYNMLGYAYYYRGDFDKSLDYINKYSSLAKGQANPLDSHGEILFFLGRYDEALEKFRSADSIKPGLDFVLAHIGNTYRMKGMYRDAIGAFLKGREITQGDRMKGEFNMGIVRCYLDLDQYDKAMVLCRENIDKKPSDLNAQCILGTLLAETGRIREAEEQLSVCQYLADSLSRHMNEKELNSPFAAVDILQAYLARAKGDKSKAAGQMRIFIDRFPYPQKFDFINLLADGYNQSGQFDSTISIGTEALKRNPNLAYLLLEMSEAYEATGQVSAQRETLTRFLSVFKNSDDGLEVVIKAREKLAALDKNNI